MRIVVGMPAEASDGLWGELADVVIDPVRRRLTHLIVQPPRRHDEARLVPIEALARCDHRLELSWTTEQIERAPRVEQSDYHEMGEWPELEEGWDIGVSRVWAQPYYPSADWLDDGTRFETMLDSTLPITETFDRIPAGTSEIRRTSEVWSSDHHRVGTVDAFVIGPDEAISHLVLDHGHLWGRRDITVPIGDVATIRSDRVELRATKDEVGSYPSVPFRRGHLHR